MVFIIDDRLSDDILSQINRAVESATVNDLIVTPTILSYNKTLRLLQERKPDTLIYVRLASAVYFPMIGIELYHGTDNDPVIDVQPPDETKFV